MAAVRVELYQRPETVQDEVLAFLDSLPYAPRQHDPRWQRVYDALPNESFMAAIARDAGRVIGISTFCVYQGPFGSILHGNPYMGYGGCSCLPQRSAEVIHALLPAVLGWAKDVECITATVVMPPFCAALEDIYISAMQPDFCFENFYQYSCLNEHPVRRLKRKRRSAFMSEIRRAETAGVELVPARTIAGLDAWLDIYEARYAEIGATGPPRAYLRRLWEVFAPTDHAVLWLAELNGRLLGGTLFLLGRGIVDYFISVFTSASMKFYPSTLLLHRALERFVDEGAERFNWQSSPSRDSGVYAYKKRWGAIEATYPILTRVLGDIRPLLGRPLSEIRQAYNGHFVLPYELWETA